MVEAVVAGQVVAVLASLSTDLGSADFDLVTAIIVTTLAGLNVAR